jgi:hypothetical protein
MPEHVPDLYADMNSPILETGHPSKIKIFA